MNLSKKNFCIIVAESCNELVHDNLAAMDLHELCKQMRVYQDLCEKFGYLWLSLLINTLANHVVDRRFKEAKRLALNICAVADGLK